jgi:riboflavin synthase
MFTGLVETTGTLAGVERRGSEARVALEVALAGLALGESVSVSGVCLTATSFDDHGFVADVSAETLSVTTLGKLGRGDRVNIERSCRLGDRLGGHLVLGHVDGVGKATAVAPVGDAWRVTFEAPAPLARYFAPKGSVTIDGVSLTINRLVGQSSFEVMLVPHTLAVTTLGGLRPGAAVNLEVDVLARYVARQLEAAGIGKSDDRLMDALRRGGFLD